MNTVGAEEMACTDEIKVYEDEGEEDEQAKSSENLTEDKVGLVIESEGQVPRLFDLFGRNGGSFFKMPWPTDSRLASYFLPGYPAAIAAVMAAANNMRSPSVSSPASSSGRGGGEGGGDGGGGGGGGGNSLFGMSSGSRQESSAFAHTAVTNGSGFLSGLSGVADTYTYGSPGTASTGLWASRKEPATTSTSTKFLPASFSTTASSSFACSPVVFSSSTASSSMTIGGYQQTGDPDRSGVYKQPATVERLTAESQPLVGNRLPSFLPNPFNFMPFYNPLRGSASDAMTSRPPREPGKSPLGNVDLAGRGAFSGPPRHNCVDTTSTAYTATVPASESSLCYKSLSSKDHTKTISSSAVDREADCFGSPAQRRAEVSCASSSLYAAAACAAAVVAAVASWGSTNATTVSNPPTMATSSSSGAAAAASSTAADLLSPSYPPPLQPVFSQPSSLQSSPACAGGVPPRKSPLFGGPLSPRNWFGPSVGAEDVVGSGTGSTEALGRQSVKTMDQGAGSPYSPSMFAAAAAAAHMHFLSAAAAAASFTGGLSNTSTSTASALGGSQPPTHQHQLPHHQGSVVATATLDSHMAPRKLLGSADYSLWQTPSRLGNAFPGGGVRANGDLKGFPFSSSSSSALSSIGEFVRSPGQGKLQDKSSPRKSVWDLRLDETSPGDAVSEPGSFRGRIGGLSRKKTHIKKPLNAFMLFMKEMRPRVQEECTLKESAAINQILGKKWHELSRAEQTKYYEMARQAKELHQRLYPGWSARDNYAYHARRRRRRRPFHRYHTHHTEVLGGVRVTNADTHLSSTVRLNGRREARYVGGSETRSLQQTTSTRRPTASLSIRPTSQQPLLAGRRPPRPVSANGALSCPLRVATKKRPASSTAIQQPRRPQQPLKREAACAKLGSVSLPPHAAGITASSALDLHATTKSPSQTAQNAAFQPAPSPNSVFKVSPNLQQQKQQARTPFSQYAGVSLAVGGLQQQQPSPRKQPFCDQPVQSFQLEERLQEGRSRGGGSLTLSAYSAFEQHYQPPTQQSHQHSRQEQSQQEQSQPQQPQRGFCLERLPYGLPLRNPMAATGGISSHPWSPGGYPAHGSLLSQAPKAPYGSLLNSGLVNNDSVAAVAAVAAMAAGELSGGSMKKCRARFGLEHQNLWCKPCRRKKKCIRFISDNEMDDFLPSAFSVGHNPAVGFSTFSAADRFGVLSRRGLAGLMVQSTGNVNSPSLSRIGQPLKPSALPSPAHPPFGQFPLADFGRQYPHTSQPLPYTQTGIPNQSAYPKRSWLDPRRAFDLSSPGQTNGLGAWNMAASRYTGTVPWAPTVTETSSTAAMEAFSNQHESHRISSMMAAAAAFSAAATSSSSAATAAASAAAAANSSLGRSHDGGLLRKRPSETLGQKPCTQRMVGRTMEKQGHPRGLGSSSYFAPSSSSITTTRGTTAMPANRLSPPEFSPPPRVQVLKSDQTTAQGIMTKHRQPPVAHSDEAVLPRPAKKMRDSIGFGVADVMGFAVNKRQQPQLPSAGQRTEPAGRTNGLPGFHSDGRNYKNGANNTIVSNNTAPKLWETVSPSTSSCPLRSSPEME